MERELVKIPEIPGKISFSKTDDKEYVRYLIGRNYNGDKRYTEPKRIVIGRRSEAMPGLMYPNDHYEEYILEKGEGSMEERMTPEEEEFIRQNRIYDTYNPFFEGLFYEFKQQTRKRPDDRLGRCKAESLNKVLQPLKEMMKEEEYADLLCTVECDGEGDGNGMSNSDVMILLTQYKSALAKFRKSHQ